MAKRSSLSLLQYEHHCDPLLPFGMFIRRIIFHTALAISLVVMSLAIGVLGYRFFAGLTWIDALLNASMILGGMGSVNVLDTDSGKLFASFYALYSGVAFVAIGAVLLVPFAHRMLHRLHLDNSSEDDD